MPNAPRRAKESASRRTWLYGILFGLAALVLVPFGLRADLPVESEGLRSLFSQFQADRGLYFKSLVEILVIRADATYPAEYQSVVGTPVGAEVEYWADGERYHYRSHVEGNSLTCYNGAVAFDGDHFQILFDDAKVLSVSSTDKAGVLGVLPNPILQLVQFRYPVDDRNDPVFVRLKDIRADQVGESFWNVTWTDFIPPPNGPNRALKRAQFPGGVFEGEDYVQYVYVPAGSSHQLARIEWVTTTGRMFASVEFGDYLTSGTGVDQTCWPHSVVMTGYESDGTPALEMRYTLTDLFVNTEIPVEMFRIVPPEGAKVWDDDAQAFVASQCP